MMRMRTGKANSATRRKLWRQMILNCTLTSVFSASLFPGTAPPAQAQSILQRIQSLVTGQRAEGSASGRSRGGATRSQCTQVQDNSTLVALAPSNNEGLTTMEYPVFWFYVPFGSSPATFRLLDEQKKSVLKQPLVLRLPAQKGLVHLRLPSTEKPLDVGKRYQWFFNTTCTNDHGSSTTITVKGWIKRVQPSAALVAQLQAKSPQDRYAAYVENNIWYETVSQLAQYRDVHPQEWAELLSMFELKQLAQTPITEVRPQQ